MIKENIAKISAVVITIVLAGILLSQIKISDIITTIAGIDPFYLISGFTLYVCSYLFRALRFHILLNREIRLKDLFNIVCVHNMMNNILPARTGELSYIYLVKKSASTGKGIATLLIARAFDFISISMLFFISAIFLEELPAVISNAFLTISIFLIIIVLFLVILAYKGKDFMDKTNEFLAKFNFKRFRVTKYIIKKGNETANSFNIIKSRKIVFYSFLFSIFIWTFQYLVVYALLKAMGIDLAIPLIVLGSTFSLFVNILPIPSLGAFGVYEGAWTIAFVLLGMSKEMAIKSGFVTHIATLAYSLILGGYGLIVYGLDYYK